METEIRKTHEVVLNDVIPKSREYPRDLFEASSILVSEQPNLVPVYGDIHFMTFAEAMMQDAGEDEFKQHVAKEEVDEELGKLRGNVRNMVYGMKKNGLRGYPELIALTDDFRSDNPAVTNPNLGEFCFEIKPKRFNIGLTGRLLQDDKGQIYNERLFVDMDIFDSYDFAESICPEKIVAIMPDKKGKVIYENGSEVGQKRKFERNIQERHIVLDENERIKWHCKTEVLPNDGLKIINSQMYEHVKRYGEGTLLFGHKFNGIVEFLKYATKHGDHIIWKLCLSNLKDPNTALVDAEQYYGKYKGQQTRHENVNRLHFIPDKAALWFDSNGTSVWFDKPRGLESLFSLGDIVRDLWIDNSYLYRDSNMGWDIVLDRSRKIIPEKPVTVKTDSEYKNYPVLV